MGSQLKLSRSSFLVGITVGVLFLSFKLLLTMVNGESTITSVGATGTTSKGNSAQDNDSPHYVGSFIFYHGDGLNLGVCYAQHKWSHNMGDGSNLLPDVWDLVELSPSEPPSSKDLDHGGNTKTVHSKGSSSSNCTSNPCSSHPRPTMSRFSLPTPPPSCTLNT